jgi:Protein of unknown function (DUF1579)
MTHLKRSALALGTVVALCAQIPSRAQSADAMPASTRLAMPGDKHQWLAPLAGKWNVEMLVWPAPGAQPITSKDLTATREWILGGRYLVENLIGSFAGNPSHRVATLGYNNLEERFELSTIDTFEPGQMWYRSSSIGNARKIAMTGENTEAGFSAKPTGRKRDLRFEFEIAADSNVQKIYVKYPGEAEYLFVEQRFTRMR